MSIVAEFAANLHEKATKQPQRILNPSDYPSKSQELTDIRIVMFDLYGTLFNYWKPEFSLEESKKQSLLAAFDKTIAYFGMEKYLVEMDPPAKPANTLWDLYHGLITLKHDLALSKKVEYPEVKIEEIWEPIILMLKRRGYDPSPLGLGIGSEFVRCVAYFYNFHSFSRGLYDGVSEALVALKLQNIMLGIISNAQFYSEIDFTLFLRDQTNGQIDDYIHLFDSDLNFLSCDYGVSKPNPLLFTKLFDALHEMDILPEQTLFVGNDLAMDIAPAQEIGMKTAFYVGDDKSAFFHDCAGKVFPDMSFSSWSDFVSRVSFHSKTSA